MINVGKLVRYHRERRGWTQQQLADKMGTTKSVIGRLEMENHYANLRTIERVAEALDMDVSIRFSKKWVKGIK
jgi:transcriptional regulator with XRE-family HTH domain